MKQFIPSFLMILLFAGAANASCYADYKAKRDDPLRLHYGVFKVSGDCTESVAISELENRLSEDDWQLLAVVSLFDETGLEERKESAGDYFLRY